MVALESQGDFCSLLNPMKKESLTLFFAQSTMKFAADIPTVDRL